MQGKIPTHIAVPIPKSKKKKKNQRKGANEGFSIQFDDAVYQQDENDELEAKKKMPNEFTFEEVFTNEDPLMRTLSSSLESKELVDESSSPNATVPTLGQLSITENGKEKEEEEEEVLFPNMSKVSLQVSLIIINCSNLT